MVGRTYFTVHVKLLQTYTEHVFYVPPTILGSGNVKLKHFATHSYKTVTLETLETKIGTCLVFCHSFSFSDNVVLTYICCEIMRPPDYDI